MHNFCIVLGFIGVCLSYPIYMLWGHFNYMISNFFFVLPKPKYQDKMKELLVKLSNQLQSSDTSGSIAWSTNDVFA